MGSEDRAGWHSTDLKVAALAKLNPVENILQNWLSNRVFEDHAMRPGAKPGTRRARNNHVHPHKGDNSRLVSFIELLEIVDNLGFANETVKHNYLQGNARLLLGLPMTEPA